MGKILPIDTPATMQDRLTSLEKRIARLEHKIDGLGSMRTLADSSSSYQWGSEVGEPYYHKPDVASSLAQVAPWISTATRFSERLTSVEFVKATAGQAALLGITFTALGAGATFLFDLPWYTALVTGISGAALSVGVLVMLNRAELHSLVNAQADKSKRRSELRVQIDKAGDHGIEFLYLNSDISQAQLSEFAGAALGGKSLAVHKWTGQGALFTRGQFDDLLSELETMGYVLPGRGNVARCLNRKGLALMRGLVDV